MPISKAPDDPQQAPKKVSEKKVQAFINKGGKPTGQGSTEPEVTGKKSIKLVMTEQEMQTIKDLRDKRPSRSRKIPISVHDWVIEAIQEKIEREQKKYKTASS